MCRYECDHPGCGKRFMHLQSKKEHEFAHSGKKPFACALCPGVSYGSKANLARHNRAKHPVKPAGGIL